MKKSIALSILSLLPVLVMTHIYAALRTARVGIDLLSMAGFASLALLVAAMVFFLGRRLMKTSASFAVAVVAVLLLVCSVEIFATAQEMRIAARYGEQCEKGMYFARWAPFSNSGIACGDDERWVGND